MILIVGATGQLGGAVAQALLAQGRAVRVLVRHNSPSEALASQGLATSAQTLQTAGAEMVYGDLKDHASLAAACRGVTTVIATANSALRGGADNVQTVDLEGNRNLIDAAAAAGVQHFIFVSAQGADPNHPVPFLQAKGQTEQHLIASGLPYTLIAPHAYMEVWLAMVVGLPALTGQPVTVVGSGARRHSFVSARDVAGYILASVDNPQALNQRLAIGGPEAVSFRDTAAAFAELLGRDVPIQSVPPGEPVPGLPESMWGMLAGLDMADSPIDMADLPQRYGVTPVTVREFAARMTQR
jgi:NADH dehydrogenase